MFDESPAVWAGGSFVAVLVNVELTSFAVDFQHPRHVSPFFVPRSGCSVFAGQKDRRRGMPALVGCGLAARRDRSQRTRRSQQPAWLELFAGVHDLLLRLDVTRR
jgi:hypothetical protein